ncbi:hypothetical protein CEE45_07125 [Candidatus Heimdallarchaeota archaeon B3_Heim]|nr:MAG: hypothetical protein CEE45_07125 [Candidatus Heimdallarchaeota archaeon B3_Heim]
MAEEEKIDSNPEELELAERILELTTYLQKNSATIEELKSKINNWESKSQDLDIELGKKMRDFNDNFNSEIKHVQEEISSEIQTLTVAMETQENNFKAEISSQKQDHENLNNSLQEQEEKLGNLTAEVKEGFSEISGHLEKSESNLQSSVSALGELVRTKFEEVTKTTTTLEASVKSLNNITQIHTEAFSNVRESLLSFKEKLQEIISLSKKDQQSHFENFSRMLESFNENIRTEITLTTQNLKESDIQILNEVSEHYTRKKVGDDLQQAFASFSEEIQTQTSRSREEITQNLQNSMKEYETIIESQSQSMQTNKEELERIQSEIQAVIDRKVNEKYEAVFSLLSTVALHAEELSMLIKTAEIHLPTELSSIVENKNQENSDNLNPDDTP